jgi:hypothetical protein
MTAHDIPTRGPALKAFIQGACLRCDREALRASMRAVSERAGITEQRALATLFDWMMGGQDTDEGDRQRRGLTIPADAFRSPKPTGPLPSRTIPSMGAPIAPYDSTFGDAQAPEPSDAPLAAGRPLVDGRPTAAVGPSPGVAQKYGIDPAAQLAAAKTEEEKRKRDAALPVGGFEDYLRRSFSANPTAAQIEAARKSYTEAGAASPQAGSFADYVTRRFGANSTPAQIEQARQSYGQADNRPIAPKVTDSPAIPNGVRSYLATLPGKYGQNASAANTELEQALPALMRDHPRLDPVKVRSAFNALFPKPPTTNAGVDAWRSGTAGAPTAPAPKSPIPITPRDGVAAPRPVPQEDADLDTLATSILTS